MGTKRSKFVCVLTLSNNSTVKCSASASTRVCPGLVPRMSAASPSNSSAAAVAVREEVPVVKQTGWLVSASSTKKVCATLVGRAASSWRWRRMWRLLKLRTRCGSMARTRP